MHSITIFLASYLVFIIVALVAVAVIRSRPTERIRFIAFIIVASIVSYVFAKIAGQLYYDPRPFVRDGVHAIIGHTNDNGFPSDHMLLSSVFALSCLLYRRRIGIAVAVLAALVGVGRVAAGVHHLVDILGSILCALLGCAVAYGAFRLYDRRRQTTSK